ncbi:hypothetical protein GOV06_03350 [Candidatus Woesearchaeota archaeon]|nr:hypothetical protein [Candidatus Woesearchaeota archaeon]
MTEQIQEQYIERLRERTVLGNVLREVAEYMGRKPREGKISSPANGYDSVSPSEFFMGYPKANPRLYIVRQEHLPFDPNIKAISSTGSRLLLETSKVDHEKWGDCLEESVMQAYIKEGQKTVQLDETPIIKTRTQNVAEEGINMRTLLTILPRYRTADFEEAIGAIDEMYAKGCFLEDLTQKEGWGGSQTPDGERVQELKMELRQVQTMALSREQLPILTLKQIPTTYMIRKRIFNAKILRMNTPELEAYLKKIIGE